MKGILGGDGSVETPRSPFKQVRERPQATSDLLVFHGESCKNPFRPSRRPSTAFYASQDADESMIHVLNQESFTPSPSASSSTFSSSSYSFRAERETQRQSPRDKQRAREDRLVRSSIARDPAPPTPRGGRVRVAPGGPTSIMLG